MPFNLLLLPLLAGYLYISKSNLRSYWASQLQKEQLIFTAATYGLIFLMVSRALVLLALCTSPGRALAEWLHEYAPFNYIGTAIGTLLLAVLTWNFSNAFVNEETAGHWLYHRRRFDPLTELFWHSSIGVRSQSTSTGFLFTWKLAWEITRVWIRGMYRLMVNPDQWRSAMKQPIDLFLAARAGGLSLAEFPIGEPKPLMINLRDSKVIVGFVVDLPANKPSADFVTVLPIWTGYRDSSSRRIFKTVDYSDAIERIEDPFDLGRVIRTADIASACIWSEAAFDDPAPEDGSGVTA